MDGPLGYNRLNSPSNLGVSRQGVLYFFDSGNEYMRFVDLSGAVHTLLLGACKQCKAFLMQLVSREMWPDILYSRSCATKIGWKGGRRALSTITLTLRF